MDVISFQCLSLGSSTVQLCDSLGIRYAYACSETGINNQNGACAWGVYYRRAAFYCAFFCGQKDSVHRIFIKKCSLFMLEVCIAWSGSTFVADISLMTKRLKRRFGIGGDNKRLRCFGFRRTGKAMGQVYQCCWRICREINVFSRFEYHMFYVLYPSVTCLLILPRILATAN
jgi:hypothetical protein